MCSSDLMKMKTGCNAFEAGTDDSFDINSVVIVKTFIFDGYECMLKINRHLVNGYRVTICTGSNQSGNFITLIVKNGRELSGRTCINIIYIWCRINDSFEDSDSCTNTDDSC